MVQSGNGSGRRAIETSELKSFAFAHLGATPKLRAIILSEKTSLDAEEFLAKMEVWLNLFSMEVDEHG